MKAGNANQRQRLQDALAAQQGAGRLRSCPLTPAAPDLLAAAETCSEFFNDNGDFYRLLEAVIAAIAKAKGA